MKKILFTVFVLILSPFLYWQSATAQESTQNYIISSGSYGGNYNKTGIIIANLLNNISEKYLFTPVASSGSLENINKLKRRFADFAIVQRDVLLNNFYGNKDGIKNIH